MIRYCKIHLFVTVCSLFLFLVSGTAQDRKAAGKGEDRKPKLDKPFGLTSSRTPIDITSDTVEANQKQNVVTFKGNVVAKQENVTLYANMLTIYYDPDTKGIKTVVATGNVKIVQLERRATSQKATFHQDENKVVLDGEAVIREGRECHPGGKGDLLR